MTSRQEKSHRRSVQDKGISGSIVYRGVVQNSRNLVWVLDDRGVFNLFNKRFQEVSGYRPRAIIGRSLAEIVYPDEDLPRVEKIFSAVMEGRLLQYEVTLIGSEGKLLYLLVNASPIFNTTGSIIGVLNLAQDVTEQAHQEAALKIYRRHLEELMTRQGLESNENNERLHREITERAWAKAEEQKSNERFRALVERTTDWLWEIDENARYTYVSPKVTEILGYSPDEVIGKMPFEFMPPDEAKHVADEFSVIAKARSPFYGLLNKNVHKDSRLVMIETNGVPIFDDSGNFCGYRGIDRDVTARHAAEELKDEFISLVSHELKTPLTVILGGLSTLLAGGNALTIAEWKELTSDAYVEAKKLAGTLDNLLQLSRARAGRLILNQHKTGVSSLLREIVKESKARYPGHRFIVYCPSATDIDADKACLERVIINLVDNAAKYSPAGRPVSVKVKVGKENIVFGVSDHGEGIPPEKQAKLFNLFERLGKEKIEGDRGTGVGLAVCKLLVQASGGTIWLDSRVGKGSTFYFSLPLHHQVGIGESSEMSVP